ncbi:MAG: hypothetical protein V1694_07955 [Candidatus Eisenbacteria bacterium]
MSLDPEIRETLLRLADLFTKNKIQFVLVGAIVPQVLIDLKEANGKGYGFRGTVDVDCAVAVESWSDFDDIKAKLAAAGFVMRGTGSEHRFYDGRIPVDILPYGVGLLQDNILVWPQSGRRMNMSGFGRLFEFAKQERIAEGVWVPVAPVSLAVYSKIIAFQDRMEPTDLADIAYMLGHYEEISVSERRFEAGIPGGLTYDVRGAFLLGRELRQYVSPSEVQQVKSFCNLMDEPVSAAARGGIRIARLQVSEFADLVSAFKMGLGI